MKSQLTDIHTIYEDLALWLGHSEQHCDKGRLACSCATTDTNLHHTEKVSAGSSLGDLDRSTDLSSAIFFNESCRRSPPNPAEDTWTKASWSLPCENSCSVKENFYRVMMCRVICLLFLCEDIILSLEANVHLFLL